MTSISIVVSTFGDINEWGRFAVQRAIPSAIKQTVPAEGVYYNHAETLTEARNTGANQARGEWLCFLDADDELDANYMAAMATAIKQLAPDRKWLLQPATLGITDGREDPHPYVIPVKPLVDGNYLIIGTLVQRAQFLSLGGFHDWPYAEDWDLWLRCWLDDAQPTAVPDAIYRVHIRPGSRNNGDRDEQVRIYNQIRARHARNARSRRP